MTRTLPWLESTSTTPRPKRRRILEPNPGVDEGSECELTIRKSPNVQRRYDLSLTECLLVAEIILIQLPLHQPLFHFQKGMSGASSILDLTN